VTAQAEVVAQMESIQETLEALVEAYGANEKALEEELEQGEAAAHEMATGMETLAGELQTAAATIHQYRQKVVDLETMVEAAKDTSSAEAAAAAADDQTKMASMALQLNKTQAQERAKALALALAGLGQSQSRKHIDLLKTFMPEVFFQTDYNGLRLLLLLDSLVEKSTLIQENVREEFRVGDDIRMILSEESDITIDQFAFGTGLVCKVARTEMVVAADILPL